MAVTLDELRRLLGSDEPDYAAIGQILDESAVEPLRTLAQDENVMLASKAVYTSSLLPGKESEAIVETAARSADPLLRIASASALVNLPEVSRNRLAERLIDDADLSVEKLTVKAITGTGTSELRERLTQLARRDDRPDMLRELARAKLAELDDELA